jgi:hypothetical protein
VIQKNIVLYLAKGDDPLKSIKAPSDSDQLILDMFQRGSSICSPSHILSKSHENNRFGFGSSVVVPTSVDRAKTSLHDRILCTYLLTLRWLKREDVRRLDAVTLCYSDAVHGHVTSISE